MSAQQETKRYKILIRKGDQVKVMTGKDAGKSGRVLAINPRKNTVVVEHANLIKRHTRPNPSKNIKGGIIEKEAGINASNVMVVCGSCGKHTRIGHNIGKDGSRSRACRRCGTVLDK
ncbi:MAG TPA: 50S ribosomal protein L24 [Candidatus Acidoferrum sp.]|jgi:large subunit ribosomal protein L24